jgi:branched-chain amino acid transport system ATP-binding protein
MSGGLNFEGVTVRRFGRVILDRIDLNVEPGRVTALLGANGAGKGTLLRVALGFERPVMGHPGEGRIVLGDRVLNGLSVEARVRAGLGWCPEGRRLFPAMTVEETLLVACPGGAAARAEGLERMFSRFPGLAEKRRERAWRLSGGQQQMLSLARAMIAQPSVLLLDEPSLGLAPVVMEDLARIIREIADEGAAVLLAEAQAAWALSLADQGAVIARGALVAEGPAHSLRGSPELTRGLIG